MLASFYPISLTSLINIEEQFNVQILDFAYAKSGQCTLNNSIVLIKDAFKNCFLKIFFSALPIQQHILVLYQSGFYHKPCFNLRIVFKCKFARSFEQKKRQHHFPVVI